MTNEGLPATLLLALWAAATAFAAPADFRLFISDGHGLERVELQFFRDDSTGTSFGNPGQQQPTFPGTGAGGVIPYVPAYGVGGAKAPAQGGAAFSGGGSHYSFPANEGVGAGGSGFFAMGRRVG